jgi:hypothetical protein
MDRVEGRGKIDGERDTHKIRPDIHRFRYAEIFHLVTASADNLTLYYNPQGNDSSKKN